MRTQASFLRSTRQAGFTIVELMVTMAIGLVVIGAVFATYLGNGGSSRHTSALAQITEDADVALRVLRAHIAPAGFARAFASTAVALTRTPIPNPVWGCDGGFADGGRGSTVATGAATDLSCGADADAPDGIHVAYEADRMNAVMAADGVTPTDCLGQTIDAIAAAPGGAPQHFRVEARLFVNAEGELICTGNGTNGTPHAGGQFHVGEALASNIADMQITYGVGNRPPIPPLPAPQVPQQITHIFDYESASGLAAGQWADVSSVRICVLMRSEAMVMQPMAQADGTQALPRYIDCNGVATTPAAGDRRMYRAFTTTIVLHNRLAP